jgi:hypothetical protein
MPVRSRILLDISSIETSVASIIGTPCRSNSDSAALTSNATCGADEYRLSGRRSLRICCNRSGLIVKPNNLREYGSSARQLSRFEIILGQRVVRGEYSVLHR